MCPFEDIQRAVSGKGEYGSITRLHIIVLAWEILGAGRDICLPFLFFHQGVWLGWTGVNRHFEVRLLAVYGSLVDCESVNKYSQ
jgi:hypothetical protein